MKTLVSTKELQLADTVQFTSMSGWSFAIVKNITDDFVEFFRPYGKSEDFSYIGGVLCFVGIEQFKAYKSDVKDIELIERKTLK